RHLAAAAAAGAGRFVDLEPDRRLRLLLLPAHERLVYLLDAGAVEHRRGDEHLAAVRLRVLVGLGAVVVPAVGGDPSEVRLENLPEVHPARNAVWVEDYVDRRAVFAERHVLPRHDLGDHSLAPVPTGELVALG